MENPLKAFKIEEKMTQPQPQAQTGINFTDALLTKRNEIFSLEKLIDGKLSLESTLAMKRREGNGYNLTR